MCGEECWVRRLLSLPFERRHLDSIVPVRVSRTDFALAAKWSYEGQPEENRVSVPMRSGIAEHKGRYVWMSGTEREDIYRWMAGVGKESLTFTNFSLEQS